MKKTFLSFISLVFFACSFIASAQTPTEVCKLQAKFEFRTQRCFVQFADLSAAASGTTITNWYWDFGDATVSTLQNPTHTYTANGTYTVCLTIVGSNPLTGLKCKDQFCAPVVVDGCGQTDPCKLAAKFDFKTDGCKAGFADLSVTAPGTTIVSWYWDFGDATGSTLQNPTHVYTASGVYTVCLTIVGVNAAGVKCTNKFCQPVTIKGCGQTEPCKLAAKFSYKIDKCTAYFADASATGAGTTITNWYWDFGDATTSTLQNPSHVYGANGTYTVCLVIVGVNNATGEQCKDKFCQPVTISGCGQTLPCGVKPLFNYKVDKCTVYFVDNSGTNAGTTITSWYWTFGDGTTSTVQNPVHAFTAAGTYTVCLTAYAVNTTGEECKNTYCKAITVDGCGDPQPCKLEGKFDYKVDKCTAYFADASASGSGTTITNWYWDFGDGSTSVLQNPSHVYASNGTYLVCLVIVGSNATGEQCKDRLCQEVKIDGCGDPQPCKLAAKFDYKVDKCTAYFADASASGSGTTITNWYWDFGDGSTSVLQNPSHVYASNGTYLVCLVIVGSNATGEQCKDRLCQEVKIDGCGDPEPCKVAAKFDYKVDNCTVYFTDYSGTGSGTNITYWEWNFGDGSPLSYVQHPVHAYAAPGTYVVCLIVVGTNPATGEQCKDKVCMEVTVKDCGQTSDCKVYPKFDLKTDQCTAYFIDFSTGGPGTTLTGWYWTFGDGNTSAAQNPVHTYAAPGTYEVCLIVVGTDVNGRECKDIICQKITVNCDQPGKSSINAKATVSAVQVYPNPAQNNVNIEFKADVAGPVNITVTDIQGRVLSVIQDGNITAGFHKLTWNVDVHSGLYFITIKTNSGIQQKQVVIQE